MMRSHISANYQKVKIHAVLIAAEKMKKPVFEGRSHDVQEMAASNAAVLSRFEEWLTLQ